MPVESETAEYAKERKKKYNRRLYGVCNTL